SDCGCAVVEIAPIAELSGAPDKRVHMARPGFERRNVMASDRRHTNLFAICGAKDLRAVIGFQHATPVVVMQREDAEVALAVLRLNWLSVCPVVEIHVQLIPSAQLKDAFCRASGDERKGAAFRVSRVLSAIEATSDVGEAERPDQPLRNVVAFDRRK